jgi:hypothetical protein
MENEVRAKAHTYFSADCFNRIWELMEKSHRSDEDNQEMLRLTFASHWHWTRRDDVDDTKLSVALWMNARVAAVIGMGELALDQARRCLEISGGQDIPPFYLGYAHEALARAHYVRGEASEAAMQLQAAEAVSAAMPEGDEKTWLAADLQELRGLLAGS